MRDYCHAHKRQVAATGALKRTLAVPLYSVCRCHEGEGAVLQSKARPTTAGNAPGVGFQVVSVPPDEQRNLDTYAACHHGRPCTRCGALESLYWWSAQDVADACAEAAEAAAAEARAEAARAPTQPAPRQAPPMPVTASDAGHFCHGCFWRLRDDYAALFHDAEDEDDGEGGDARSGLMAVDATQDDDVIMVVDA